MLLNHEVFFSIFIESVLDNNNYSLQTNLKKTEFHVCTWYWAWAPVQGRRSRPSRRKMRHSGSGRSGKGGGHVLTYLHWYKEIFFRLLSWMAVKRGSLTIQGSPNLAVSLFTAIILGLPFYGSFLSQTAVLSCKMLTLPLLCNLNLVDWIVSFIDFSSFASHEQKAFFKFYLACCFIVYPKSLLSPYLSTAVSNLGSLGQLW